MKKAFLFAAIALMAAGTASAQGNKNKKNLGNNHSTEAPTQQVTAPMTAAPINASEAMPAVATPTTTLTLDNIVFTTDKHDFGTLREGDPADYSFILTNTGKEPMTITHVQPSCGCTAADYSKDAIAPGKTGFVKTSYGTNGRPGAFNKTITVMTNAGSKMLYISGNVEKAPESSAPQNSSMIRTN